MAVLAIVNNSKQFGLLELFAVSVVATAYSIYLMSGILLRYNVRIGFVEIEAVYFSGFTPQMFFVLAIAWGLLLIQLNLIY